VNFVPGEPNGDSKSDRDQPEYGLDLLEVDGAGHYHDGTCCVVKTER
jgi:hypothetical protein